MCDSYWSMSSIGRKCVYSCRSPKLIQNCLNCLADDNPDCRMRKADSSNVPQCVSTVAEENDSFRYYSGFNECVEEIALDRCDLDDLFVWVGGRRKMVFNFDTLFK